ncbi:YopX protein [Leptospira wolbachii serovar Codice str. CDC]|uniref:YopX protein n=1 Tax=Leptospira wolbachii serovar Codice str. CDC TaxID=1218599 RepID=R9A7J2_9LEPT|nr:YopX family protein [Leptospira wolbachii]EOQ97989.1 YopX protein [Leptospira wolbachii serovar Codice str. CDC]
MAFTIRFRVWDKQEKEFTQKGFSLTLDGKLLKFGQPITNEDNFIVNSFTGLKDKYDKDLFEEDIIEHTVAKGGNLTQHTGVIRYNNEHGAFYLENGPPLLQLFSMRKVGNPYENPILYDLYLKSKS